MRVKIAQELGWDTIPVTIRDVDPLSPEGMMILLAGNYGTHHNTATRAKVAQMMVEMMGIHRQRGGDRKSKDNNYPLIRDVADSFVFILEPVFLKCISCTSCTSRYTFEKMGSGKFGV
jgi:ParB-like chromosome segregation protein Spo0J